MLTKKHKPKCRIYGYEYDYSERIRSLVGQYYQIFGFVVTNDVVVIRAEERAFWIILKDNQYTIKIKQAILEIFGPVSIKDIPPAPITLHMNPLNSTHRLYFEMSRKEVSLEELVELLGIMLIE